MKNKITFLLATTAVFLALSHSILAEDEIPGFMNFNNYGTEFWLTVPPSLEDNSPGHENYIKIIVTSYTETMVTVEVPAKAFFDKRITKPFQQIEFNLTPQMAQPYLKSGHDPEVPEEVYKSSGIWIKSEEPIAVFVVVRFRQSSDGFLALPVNTLGREYIVSSYADGSAIYGLYTSMPSLTGIVATQENTQIKFTYGGNYVAAAHQGYSPGDTVVRILNRGDVWMLSSKGQESDLTGSKIQASKPVSVISGNQSASIPLNNKWDDYIVEMETPMETWGKYYHVAPIMKRKFSPILRIFARYPNTKIYKNGREIATIKTSGGPIGEGFVEIPLYEDFDNPATAAVFSSDQPIYIAAYNTGTELDNHPLPPGDPFQMTLTPIDQYQKEIMFSTAGIRGGLSFPEHYVNLIFEPKTGGFIPEDLEFGIPQAGKINWIKFTQAFPGVHPEIFPYDIDGRQYALLKFALPGEGIYALRAAKPIAAYVYGFSENESYGYPASLAMYNLDKEDNMPPVPTWTVNCDGRITGTVTDYPDDDNLRANLAAPLFYSLNSFNLDKDLKTIPVLNTEGIRSAMWEIRVIDPTKDAYGTIKFYDRRGNDTLIHIKYTAVKISLQEKYIDYGIVMKNDIADRLITVKNSSENEVTISKLELKNGKNGFKILDCSLPFTMPAYSEKVFTVRFHATDAGFFVDSIGLGDSCIFFNSTMLEATVGYPEINVDDVHFGDVTVGSSKSPTVNIYNSGVMKLVITGYKHPASSLFKPIFDREISETMPLIINPKENYRFNVEFWPVTDGTLIDSIVFYSNAEIIDSVALLTASGVQPGLIASSYDWGRRRIYRDNFKVEPYPVETTESGIVIKNDGSAKATILDYEIELDNKAEAFDLDKTVFYNMELNPGESRVIPVKFLPKETGEHELIIKYIDKNGSKTRTRLYGFGVVPKISIQDITFDTTVVGDERITSHRQFFIENLGVDKWQYADTAYISDILISPDTDDISLTWDAYGQKGFKINFADFKLPAALPPGTTLKFDASFKALTEGESQAFLTLLSDDIDSTNNITLKGWGITNEIEISGGDGLICPGKSLTILCRIQNYSSRKIEITNIKFEPAEDEFTFGNADDALGFTMEPGELRIVPVVFAPVSFVKKNVNLVFQSPGSSESEYRVRISGEADRINRTLSISPIQQLAVIGQKAECRVYLEDGRDISDLDIQTINLKITYNSNFLKLFSDTLGNLLQGRFHVTKRNIDYHKGELTLTLQSIAGEPLKEKGEIFRLMFSVFLPTIEDDISNINIEADFIGSGAQCLSLKTKNATIGLKPTCLYDLRKVVFSPYSYALPQVNPNPITGSKANIEFTVGLEGYTEITLYNANGQAIIKPVAQVLKEGDYSFEISTTELSQGLYFINMSSGQFAKSQKIMIVK